MKKLHMTNIVRGVIKPVMDELLTTIETNLKKLGAQYKSGQAVLIIDALNALEDLIRQKENHGKTEKQKEDPES